MQGRRRSRDNGQEARDGPGDREGRHYPIPFRWNRLGVAGARRPGARNTGELILPPQATAALAAARRRRQKASPRTAAPAQAA